MIDSLKDPKVGTRDHLNYLKRLRTELKEDKGILKKRKNGIRNYKKS